MGSYDVMLFDPYFCDLIVTGLPDVPRLGMDLFGQGMGIHAGGTFNTVRALHRLGLRVGWACDFGNDLFSQFVLSEVRKEGVDPSLFRIHDHPVRSFSLAFSFADDRGFISYIDPVEPCDPIPYLLEHRPRSILLYGLKHGPEIEQLVEVCRQVGTLVCLDCQATQLTLETPGVIQTLESIDIFLPNASEARQLTGARSAESAAQVLSKYTPLVVVKMGAEGALAQRGECSLFSPALKIEVVDTTGAGDCFNAGFLYSHLQGDPLEMSLRIGNICGGLSATAYGTVATPTLEELAVYLERSE